MNIESLIETVMPECTVRFDCPLCLGRNTLSISKYHGEVLYRCFKLDCPLKPSRKPLVMSDSQLALRYAPRTHLEGSRAMEVPFKVPDYWIMGLASKKCYQMLLTTNSIEAYLKGLFRVAYDPRQDRLVYLITDSTGKIVGGVGRALNNQLPKAYNYPSDSKLPFTCGSGGTAVIVEDCASACSISRIKDYTGIALLGTEINTEYMSFVVMNFSNIIIALDKDAVVKSIKLRQRLQHYVDNIIIWRLNKDLKELTQEEIQTYIKLQSII